MRTIKFRVMDTEKKWVYFDLIKEQLWNTPEGIFDLRTVTQWTGLLDKSEKEIYEGDIMQVNDAKLAVTWDTFGWALFDSIDGIGCNETWLDSCFEVIGNIYENPEMLRGGE